ncbi:hypothetical protein TNCV_3895331 [Trichonephila clavipes]|nr:hypothetical protein TNCV_3895331 [Trichonephila clavipes]
MPPSKTTCWDRCTESCHRVHLGAGNENLDSDFRNFPDLAGYCRNEVEWLCDRVPHGGQTAHSAFKLKLDIHKKPGAMFTIGGGGANWLCVETLRLIISTRVNLEVDQKKQVFADQLLDIGNCEVELHPNT